VSPDAVFVCLDLALSKLQITIFCKAGIGSECHWSLYFIFRISFDQCCGAVNISFGSGFAELEIGITVPAPVPDSSIRYR